MSQHRRGRGGAGRRRPAAAAAPVVGRIVAFGRGGDGLLRPEGGDGRAGLFVPGTVPGDAVRARPLAPAGEGPAPAALEALLSAGPQRAEPPCPHFPRPGAEGCGGCRMQMLQHAAYLDWKVGLARAALAQRGFDPDLAGQPLVAPQRSRRRAGFAVLRRTEGTVAGFRGWRSHRVEDLSEACLVCAPPLLALLPQLRVLGTDLLRPGREMAVQATVTEAGLDVVLRAPEAAAAETWPRLTAFAEAADLARLSVAAGERDQPEPVLLRRPPELHFGPVAVVPPAGGFLQAVPAVEAAMQAEVAAWLAGAGRVLDLYAGCGTLSLPLVDAAPVHAVDSDGDALQALQSGANLAARGGRVSVQQRDLASFPLTGPALDGFDAAILDPPRQGAAAQAAALAGAGRRLRRIAAVSCNPVTLARDLALLRDGGWRLVALRLYDQFLWTAHLELVALLERGD